MFWFLQLWEHAISSHTYWHKAGVNSTGAAHPGQAVQQDAAQLAARKQKALSQTSTRYEKAMFNLCPKWDLPGSFLNYYVFKHTWPAAKM